jgi:LuxR family maltose regulon positive regulatory protein
LALNEPLLQTKIRIPEATGETIQRQALLEMLEQQAPNHRLTLLSAQAGYGKTSALAEWSRRTEHNVVWLSLEAEDSELDRFVRYLLAAWAKVAPEIMESDFGLLVGSPETELNSLLIAFLNELADLGQDLVFVLDDYHLIETEEIHQALSYWLDNLPARAHFVISSRSQPPFPLHRYRVGNQLFELGPEQLRFSKEEAAEFLRQRMKMEVAAETVETINKKLEGWVGGLQLAALGLKDFGTQAAALDAAGADQQYLGDYLAKDVLAQQPVELQEFLLKTSVLQQMSPPLCDHLLQRQDSREVLDELTRRNLFLQPLDSSHSWFRYHHLFAEFLRAELGAGGEAERKVLHQRAADWYLDHDFEERAFLHALASRDSGRVIQICDRYIPLKLSRGEIRLAAEWLGSIPEGWFERHPMLILGRAALNAMRGDFQASMQDLKKAEESLADSDSTETDRARARLTAFYCSTACMQNDLENAREYGQQAARELAPNDIFYHGMIHGSMGDAFRGNGQWQEAGYHYRQALSYSQGTDFQFMGIHAYGGLADMCLRQGKLDEAAKHWRRALEISREPDSWGAISLPVVGWAYIRLAEIKYEWNQLDQARQDLSAGIKRAELGGDVRALIAGHILEGYLSLADGQFTQAERAIQAARELIAGSQFPDWISRFERLQLDYWLATDDLPAAAHWMDRNQAETAPGETLGQEPLQLGLARVLLAQGTQANTDKAVASLNKIAEAAEAQGALGFQLQSLALLALAHWQSRQESEALSRLEQALRLATAEGFQRSLLDLGRPMARLLQEAASRGVRSEQVGRLLAQFEEQLGSMEAKPPLTEPLTDRELDVLELMSAGLTNKEIGEKLYISAGTVKKHAGNIYGKLGVSSRTAAAARARELSLLD